LAEVILFEFERHQRESTNAMPLSQISEAALASRDYFKTRADLDAWLARAIGEHRKLLNVSLWHLHRAVSSCPLLGEAYVHLADLCFLEGAGDAEKAAYLQQALSVRPYDGVVLLAAGSAAALRNDINGMIAYWSPVLRCRQQERQAMVKLLTMAPVSVESVLRFFQPDLSAVRLMYDKYNQIAPPEQLQPLYAYYAEKLHAAIKKSNEDEAAPLWFEMHGVYRRMNRAPQTLECLKRAVAGRPGDFDYRFRLGLEFVEQKQFAEAECHLDWCAQRRPQDGQVKEALAKAVRGRIDRQSSSTAGRTVIR
jgi:tetratricopeptide (TPR) repeat protein